MDIRSLTLAFVLTLAIAGVAEAGPFSNTMTQSVSGSVAPSGFPDRDVTLDIEIVGPALQLPGVTEDGDENDDGEPDAIDNEYRFDSISISLGSLSGGLEFGSDGSPWYLYQNNFDPDNPIRGLYLTTSNVPMSGSDPLLPDVTRIGFLSLDINAPSDVFPFDVFGGSDLLPQDGLLNGLTIIQDALSPDLLNNLLPSLLADPGVVVNIFLNTSTDLNEFMFLSGNSVNSFNVVATVPLPGAVLLLLSGLGSLALRGRRLRAAA